MAITALKFIHTLRRPGEGDDLLFGWATRSGDTDAFVHWNGSGWTEIWDLPGTDLIYDAVTWISHIFFCDGKNGIWAYNFAENSICLIENAPVVQYLIVHQDRLVGAGDARTEAEVEADSQVWPADSNRDRVLFSEVIDFETWSPNNFIDARTGTGEVISGLGINSITTSQRGAQTQLVIFKPTAILINDGVLGSGDQTLNAVSTVIGCPAYRTIKNTPFGLMFMARNTVCLLDTNPREPQQAGFPIHPVISATTDLDLQKEAAAFFHKDTYKLSIPQNDQSTTNDREWWLDMRPAIFPQEQNWYGPHTGDKIWQYELFEGELIGAEAGTARIWKLDVEGQWGSMADSGTARSSVATTGRVQAPGMKEAKLDAYGFVGEMTAGVQISTNIDIDRNIADINNTWTAPGTLPDRGTYTVIRPVKRPGHDAQLSITHAHASDMEIHSLYLRSRERRRQSEKQKGSSQG